MEVVCALIEACRGKPQEGLSRTVKDNPRNALMYAINKKSKIVVQKLIEAGISINTQGPSGDTAAIMAVRTQNLELVELVVKNGKADLSISNENGETALTEACKKLDSSTTENRSSADAEIALFLLQHGKSPSVNTITKKGQTALYLACVRVSASKGSTNLSASAFEGLLNNETNPSFVDVVQQLLVKGADPNLGEFKPLFPAIRNKSSRAVELLIKNAKKKLDIHVECKDGPNKSMWPLHFAVRSRDHNIVKALLEAGARPNDVDQWGATPLHYAVQESKFDVNTSLRIERLLVKHNANVNAKDKQGRTPLHIAFVDLNEISTMALTQKVYKNFIKHENIHKKVTEQERKRKEFVKKFVDAEDVGLEGWAIEGSKIAEERWAEVKKKMEAEASGKQQQQEEEDRMELDGFDASDPVYATRKWELENSGGRIKADPIDIISYFIDLDKIQFDKPDKFGRTPLHYAARVGAFTCTSYLLERKAKIDEEDKDGNTPTGIALLYAHGDYCIMMANKGADVLRDITQPDGTRQSILKCSLSKGFMSLTYLIKQKQLDLLQAIHDALCTGKFHLASLLCSQANAAQMQVETENGQNLFHILANFRPFDRSQWLEYCTEIFDILIENCDSSKIIKRDKFGRTPLHYACKHAMEPLVGLLLKHNVYKQQKAAWNVVDVDGHSPLTYALTEKSYPIVMMLILAGANVQLAKTKKIKSPVRLAVDTDNLEILKNLLSRKSPVDKDIKETTALMEAIGKNNEDMVRVLLAARANPNKRSIVPKDLTKGKEGVMLEPIFLAVKRATWKADGHCGTLQMLLESGAEPNVVSPISGKTPLIHALDRSDWPKVKILLKHGADVNVVHPTKKRTPFQTLVLESPDAIQDIFSYDGDLNKIDEHTGNTLIDLCIKENRTKLLQKLLENGANPNVRSEFKANPHNATSLMLCAKLNELESLKMILQFKYPNQTHRPDLDARDDNGRNLVHCIVQPQDFAVFENVEMLKFVVSEGIQPRHMNQADRSGRSPVHYAKLQSSQVMYEALLKLGAASLTNVPPSSSSETMDLDFPEPVDLPRDAEFGRSLLEKEAEEEEKRNASKSKKNEKKKSLLDPQLKLSDDVAEVVLDGTDPYDVLMTKTDVDKGLWGLNLFYRAQVVHQKIQDLYILWTRWGQVGEIGQYQRTPFPSKEDCVAEFLKVYKEKTGIHWEDRSSIKEGERPKPGKFAPLKIVERKTIKLKPFDLSKARKAEVSQPIESLMTLFTDVATMQQAVSDAHLGLPLGNLPRGVVEDAYKILCKIRDVIKEMNALQNGQRPNVKELKLKRYELVDLSNQYFQKVPTVPKQKRWFYNADNDETLTKVAGLQPILTLDQLNEHMMNIQSLRYVDSGAHMMMAAYYHAQTGNPLDYIYRALSCRLDPILDTSSSEFQTINNYMKSTAKGHEEYEIINLFRAERKGELERFLESGCDELHNRRLLWHGSRLSNFLGILSQGLRVAPIEAPVSGYMFGKGVYFADMFAKSINYATSDFGNRTDSYACLLLCEVALGDMYEQENAEYMERAPNNCHSTKGLGLQGPPDSKSLLATKDGIQIPQGPPVQQELRKDPETRMPISRCLNYNEFIVYDASQVRIRYVVLVRDSRRCHLCCRRTSVKALDKYAESWSETRKEKIKAETHYPLPSKVLKDNEFERFVVETYLGHKGVDWDVLFAEEVGPRVLEPRAYEKIWQPITPLLASSQVCNDCVASLFTLVLNSFIRVERTIRLLVGSRVPNTKQLIAHKETKGDGTDHQPANGDGEEEDNYDHDEDEDEDDEDESEDEDDEDDEDEDDD
ncbi:hypothetical protein HK102_011472 [Quaeritorhiza haematococci]|nr:hypothetical protein HK102_011472 [Quaeritorhiza haematococci]